MKYNAMRTIGTYKKLGSGSTEEKMVKNEKEFKNSLEGKGFKKNFTSALGYYGAMFLVLLLVVSVVSFAIPYVQNWQRNKFWGLVTNTPSDANDNPISTEAKERFHVVVPDKEMNFYINVSTNTNTSYLLGMFKVSYAYKKDLTTPEGKQIADVIYYLPNNFYIKTAKDSNVTFESKVRYPATQKEARRDPTFFKGKDYPDTIPFDEIEITDDFVYSYIDTNETEYDFIVRVFEKSDDLNIVSVSLLTPPEYEIRMG